MSGLLADWAEQFPTLLKGLLVNVELTVASLAVGLPLGLLLAVLASSSHALLRISTIAVVEVGRGTPALVLLQFLYFGLPQVDLKLESFVAAVAGLGLTTAAYTSEIMRSGIQAVPAGQREAAQAAGLSQVDQFRFIILPQGLRIAMPPLINFAILIFQGTTLCFTIAVPELLSQSYAIGSRTFHYAQSLGFAAVLFAAVTLPGVALVRALERRLAHPS
ncbi:amino acid ABC transporter permease [Actinomadura sp. B10D3]|uniref:amino acid ABC transporter permease n=1 Tax=Actinomadura sp. B10D3 TaxID=3153557 RepID=UPI00325F23D6